MLKKFLCFLFFVPFLLLKAKSQTRADLEKDRIDIQRQIDDVRHSLDETKKNKKETLGQLALLQRKLRLRQRAIQNVNQQINVIEGEMNQKWREILKLRRELDTLKQQYEKSVVYAYKNRSNYDFLNFIFAAANFNDALKRVAYLKSYRSYREQQAENIKLAQKQLNDRISGLKVNREQKSQVLDEQNKQKTVLVVEKNEKDVVVSKLRSREKELTKDLKTKQRQDSKIKIALTAAIRREIESETKRQEALAKTEKKTTTGTNTSTTGTGKTSTKKLGPLEANPDIKLASDNFEKNKHHLPWPVESGNVIMEFGRQKVMEGSSLIYNNTGITIETKQGMPVKAVFDGEITSVFNVDNVTAVVVRHGKYFTSYSGLESVSVSKNQQVKTGQILGRMAEKSDGLGELEFIIMNDKYVNLSPRQWLR